tara:strand:- start:1694 stop:1849 length:156 start_codon:yes stop_codon:yes gene_type:complete
MSDMKDGYCACCKNPVSYFKYAGHVRCMNCGAATIPLTKIEEPNLTNTKKG